MKFRSNNYAYIDSQNLHLGITKLGWKLDYKKFRIYLAEKYNVTKAYMFMGFILGNEGLYLNLYKSGFIIRFKPTTSDPTGKVKGNVDADLVLCAMLDFDKYDNAVLISNDGDFYSLISHLRTVNKLKVVLSPNRNTCSRLLSRSAKEKMQFINDLQEKLEYKMKKHRLRTEP